MIKDDEPVVYDLAAEDSKEHELRNNDIEGTLD